jgi:PAS domain S-box-containing protein
MTSDKDSAEQLRQELEELRAKLHEVQQEKDDLETLLDMTTTHSDLVEEELHQAAEQAIRDSERRLRLIVEANPFPMMIFKKHGGRVVYVNKEVGPLIGREEAQVLEMNLPDFFPNRTTVKQVLKEIGDQGELNHYEVPVRKNDGHIIWIELSARPISFNNEACWLCAFYDITERRNRTVASARFVPTEFLEFFKVRSIVDLELGDFISEEMTVMFSDVRSFITISEDMTPKQNFEFVNAYLGRVSPVIREHQGFIVKYLGDGMMAVFPNDPCQAILAGIEKLQRVHEYNSRRVRKDYLPLKVGIGVHTGHMMVGMVGEKNRMQGDAFSDDVNLTSRIEGLTKFYDTSFIISAETRSKLADPDQFSMRFLDRVRVKGRSSAVELYEIFDADLEETRTLKLETQSWLSEAQEHFYARRFRETQRLLFRILQIFPDDKLSWHYLMRATKCLQDGVSEGWSGVTVMKEK